MTIYLFSILGKAKSNTENIKGLSLAVVKPLTFQAFQPHLSENELEEEEALTKLLQSSTNSNHKSTVSKELKLNKSSTA
jgi:hypothetical protein